MTTQLYCNVTACVLLFVRLPSSSPSPCSVSVSVPVVRSGCAHIVCPIFPSQLCTHIRLLWWLWSWLGLAWLSLA